METSANIPSLYVIGDLHLDHLIWKRHRQVADDSILGLNEVSDLALRNRVPVLLAGDVFDTSDPDPDLVQMVRVQAELLHRAGVRVMALQGNHDRRPVPWYSACSDVIEHVGDGRPFEVDGIRLVGFDFALKDQIEAQLAQLSADMAAGTIKADVLILHQAVRQYLGIEGKWNCDLDWVPREISTVLMGDIHDPVEVRARDGVAAYYTGSTHPRSITEFGPKSVIGLHRDRSITRTPIRGRRFLKLVLTPMSSPDEANRELDQLTRGDHVLPPVVWIRHDELSFELVEQLRARWTGVSGLIVLTEPIVGRVEIEESGEIETTEVPSPAAALAQLVDQKVEPEVYQLALDLLAATSTRDISDRIAGARDRFFATQAHA